GIVKSPSALPALVIAENIQLKRLALGYQIDAADRDRTNGIEPLVSLLEKGESSLRQLQRASCGKVQRHLVLTGHEFVVFHCDLHSFRCQFTCSEAMPDILRQIQQRKPDIIVGFQINYTRGTVT